MKTTWDELMRYAPERQYTLDPLESGEAARILKQTKQKLHIAAEPHKRQPSVRRVLLAAVIAALLCVSALAAHSLGWFEKLFGASAAQVESSVTVYAEDEQADITAPAYTQEEQDMIAAGVMHVPEQAELAELGASAQTDDFVFTLESMLVSDDSLYAMMRIEAKTADAAKELAALPDASPEEKERGGMLFVSVSNNTGTGREREWKNGGMGMDIVEVDGNTAYALLSNTGGEFETGDTVLFWTSYHDDHANLFELPVPERMQTKLVIPLDESAGNEKTYCWDTATITPISFRLDGRRNASIERNETEVSITLNDGTSFSLGSAATGYASSAYGSYGFSGYSGTGSADSDAVKASWLFSRMLDLTEIDSVSVNGRTYHLQDYLK